ncbi:hypothetical protein [Kitasatospora nipponensis]|uniref:hypothetical protein n=1 Tax=Kitasatospora nipponensis TaxID=258049 RepID=UPI0031D5CBEB
MAVAVLVDMVTAEKLASIGGALIALVGLAITMRELLQGGGSGRERQVHAENGGVAAGDNIIAAGASGPPATGGSDPWPHIDKRDVNATGQGSIAAGGDIHGIDLNRSQP